MEPYQLSATEALQKIRRGDFSPVEWLESCLARIAHREPDVKAWAYLNTEVGSEVRDADTSDGGPSIPVGVKDVIDVGGMPTRFGTTFADPTPVSREGGSIAILRNAGCAFVGKTACTELGHRHPCETRNPHNLGHTPGGSSSGSAAAVADGMVPLALGTQTSGSVIRPAAYCGVVGYKPTYNDFDKTGVLANAPSMDTVGLFARSVDDIALLRAMLLEEAFEPIAPIPFDDLTVSLLRAPPWHDADAETQRYLSECVEELGRCGARIVDIDLGNEVARLTELHRLISGYEFRRSIAFERFHHVDDLSRILREGRLADGVELNPASYQSALQERTRIQAQVSCKAFSTVDVLVGPAASGPAPHGLNSTGTAAFNSAWTLAGNPTITIPIFRSAALGLPVGCQLICDVARDDHLLRIASHMMNHFDPIAS